MLTPTQTRVMEEVGIGLAWAPSAVAGLSVLCSNRGSEFSHEGFTLWVACLVGAPLWMSELNADG